MTSHLALVLLLAAADPAPVPVERAADHPTYFQNEWVQAFRVSLPAGKTTLLHTHAHDDVAVRLSEASVVSETPGKPAAAAEHARPGIVSARNNDEQPLTHRVKNVGATTFDVIDVQILKRPPGDATAALVPPAAENPRMRAYRWELAPGATSATHTHTRPYLIIAATDLSLRMTAPDGRVMVHPVKAGDVHWVEAPVTHALANDGTGTGVLVEVELK